MKKTYILLLWVLFSFVGAPAVWAQQNIFIPAGAHVFSHERDSIGIFGDVINNGNLGSAQGAVINFLGTHWENSRMALLPGSGGAETPGGIFRFSGNQQQILASGYNFNAKAGPSFPNLSIENASGIELQDLNDLHIRGNLHFQKGYLFLNGWNTLVDDTISGYSANGFVVTGGDIGGGSLYREAYVNSYSLVFPIGTAAESYSPMSIKSIQSVNNMVGTSVFNHVYLQAVSEKKIDSHFVKKTWVVKKAQGMPQTEVFIQHDDADEGALFSHYRDSSYVSLYNQSQGLWDMDTLNHYVVHPGTLTTGTPRNFDYLNNRTFPNGIPQYGSDSISWLSITTQAFSKNTCPVVDLKLWEVQRYNHQWVQLFWRTSFEQNIMTYEVQRRLDTGSIYQTVATVHSQGNDGFSNNTNSYNSRDQDQYDGWSYYRLKMISASGCVAYSKEQAVSWGIDVIVWPNPSTTGNAHIQVKGARHTIKMQLVNAWGEILGDYDLENNQTVSLKGLSDAMYFLVFRDPKKGYRKITTVKLVVQQAK